jgi:hypothetical protein
MDEKKTNILNFEQAVSFLLKEIGNNYWSPLYKYLTENPSLIKTFPGFLLNAEQVVLYLGKTHLAIEYFGPENIETIREKGSIRVNFFDYSLEKKHFLDLIIGFGYDSTLGDIRLPLPQFSDEWVLPTNAGIDKLIELKWNFSAQNSIIGINTGGFELLQGQFSRIVNGLFFDSDDNGLKTRHIKWIDFVPLTMDTSKQDADFFTIKFGYINSLVENDANYIYPLPPKDDYKFSKLPQLNRFIELIGNKETSEPQITKFLEQPENKFILTMGFLAKEIFPQLECEWQSENRDNIKPDFFVIRPNGYGDIVEFKLPITKGETIVGKHNRESFSAELNSYISQTRKYRTYFEDPNNRVWVENKYTFKVLYPKRILIFGRRWNFSSEEWKAIINDYKDLEIMTYDDLVDGVVAQFYM